MENVILQALAQMEERIVRHVDERIERRFNDLQDGINDLRVELKSEINDLRVEMNRRFDEIEEKQTEVLAMRVQELTHRVEKLEIITRPLL